MTVLALLPPVQSLFRDLACPSGWTIVGTSVSTGGGVSVGAVCQQGTKLQALSWLFRLACGALTAASAASVGLVLTLRNWLAARRRQNWLSLGDT